MAKSVLSIILFFVCGKSLSSNRLVWQTITMPRAPADGVPSPIRIRERSNRKGQSDLRILGVFIVVAFTNFLTRFKDL